MIETLRDEKKEVRRTAAIALGKIKDPRAVEALTAALADEKASVRRRAAVALGETHDSRVEELLNEAVKKKNLEVIAGPRLFYPPG